MVNKTKKGSGFFKKNPVQLNTDKLFKLLSDFRNISDKISDDDFMDSLVQYKNLMGGFLTVDNKDDSVDHVTDLINNYDKINLTKDTHMDYKVSLNTYFKIIRMDSNFKELLKIINGIIELGVYKYKLLLNQNIPEKILSILSCRLQDFKEILEYNYFFDKEKTYRGLKWIDNRTKSEKIDDQMTHHYKRHSQFFDKLRKIDKKLNSSNPVFDNLCIRKTARYVSTYRFNKHYDNDDDDSNKSGKKKGGFRKLKSYK